MKRRTLFLAPVLCTLLALAAPTQDPEPTAAESAFQQGWWLETAQSDLKGALEQYLAATRAEGPEQVRARALLRAGHVHQRLGNAETAIGLLEKLLREFPGQAELAEKAREHLRELTAVDVRTDYDAWYRRYLFSDDVQKEILAKIDELVSLRQEEDQKRREFREVQRRLEESILAYGEGAVPALRRLAGSPEIRLADFGIGLLLRLEVLPPADALSRSESWIEETRAWQLLLRAGPAARAELQALFDTGDPLGKAVHAALSGPGSLQELMAGTTGGELMTDGDDGAGWAILEALLEERKDRGTVFALARQEGVPLSVRRHVELLFLEHGWPGVDPGTLLEWGRAPLVFEVRERVLGQTAHSLRRQHGAAFDEVLSRMEQAPAIAREGLLAWAHHGFMQNPVPLQIPWTEARMRRLLMLIPALEELGSAVYFSPRHRELLLDAVFGDVTALARSWQDTKDRFEESFHDADDHRQLALIDREWHRTVLQRLQQEWPGWSVEQRKAALDLLLRQGLVHTEYVDPEPLREFFTLCRKEADPTVRKQIDALLEEWAPE